MSVTKEYKITGILLILGISIDIPEEVIYELRPKEIKEINQRVCGESGEGWRKMVGEQHKQSGTP